MTRLTMQRSFDAPAALVWEVVADHDLYGEVAPNLASVTVVDGEGVGMVRRCVDTDGNEWTERCTRWEDGRAFAFDVDVADSDFHRRLFARFDGEWRVDERDGGAVVPVAFDFDTRFGPLGALVSKYLAYRAPGLVEAIFDRWATEVRARAEARDAGRPGDRQERRTGAAVE